MGYLKLSMLNNIFMRIAQINLEGDCNSCDHEGSINNEQWKNLIDDWYDYESSMKNNAC